jgi:hypothetical protein
VSVAGKGTNDANADGEAIGAGLIAGNASDVHATDDVTVDGHIDNANVTTTGAVGISTDSKATAEADSGQVVIGLVGGGASIANASAPGTSRAYAGPGAVLHAGSVSVQAGTTGGTTAKANAFAGGFAAGNAASATADTEGTTDAYLSGATVVTTGATQVGANGARTAQANTGQIAGGILAGGASVANATVGGTTQAHTDGGTVNAGSVSVQSQTGDDANADAHAFGAGFLAGSAASATADTEGTTAAFQNGGSITTTGDTTFNSTGKRTAEAHTGQDAIGAGAGGAAVPHATVGGSTVARADGGTVRAGSLTVKSDSTEGTTADGSAFGIGLAAGNAAVATADTHGTSEAYSGSSQVNTTGNVSINATSTRTAKATTSQAAGGIVAGGGSVANATAGGATKAHADGTVTAGGDMTVEAADSNSNTDAEATSFAGGIIAGNGSSATASITPEIRGYLGGGANLNVTGNVFVRAKSLGGKSNADDSGVTIAAGGGGASDAEATVSPTLEASLRDGSQATVHNNLTIETQHAPDVSSAHASASAGTLIGTSGATANSHAEANVASFVGAAMVNVTQTLTVRTASTNNARAIGDGLTVGLLAGNGDVHASAFAGKETQAYLGNGAKVTAGALTVEAVGNDLTTTQANGSGGGLISADATHATSDVGPHVLASVTDGANVTVTNTAHLTATANPEGDAVAKAKAFGAVASGESRADVSVHPTVEAKVGGNASLNAGDVLVEAKSGNPTSPPKDTFSPPTDVDTGADTITLPNNNLPDGGQIVYDSQGNPSIDGLTSGRQYTVLVRDPNTFSLGTRFDGAAVDPVHNTITTTGPHNFKTGDRVVYESDGNPPIAGLVDGHTYFVRVLDDHTIQLAPTLADANASPLFFTPSDVDKFGHTITYKNHGLQNNQPLVYHAPNSAQPFKSFMVNVTVLGSGDTAQLLDSPGANNIYLQNNPFLTGDPVRYQCSDPAHAIGGLTPGTVYYVIREGDNLIQLAKDQFNANAGIALPLTPDKSAAGAQATHSVMPANDLPISPLVDGVTYYARVSGPDTFGLATAPDGNLLPIDGTGLTGFNTLLPGIIPLGAGSGRQALRLDLASQPGGNHKIEGPGGVPLSLVYAPSGDGQSTATASGSGGGAFVGSVGANGVSTATPVVRAFVDVGPGNGTPAVQARGNITFTSTSIANVSGNANNSSGGAVGIGTSYSAANVDNRNEAFVGDGAAIVAGGGVTMTATTTNFTSANSDASGGGVIDTARARSDSNVDYDTKARTGANAYVTAGGLLEMNSGTSTQASTRAHSDGSGGGVNSNANDDGEGTTDERGVRIGVVREALSQVEIGAGSVVHAANVDLEAQLTQSQGTSHSDANAFGLGAGCNALSRVVEHDHANVAIRSGARVTGDQTVTIGATTAGQSTDSLAHTDNTAVGGDTNNFAIADVETPADVTAEAGALVTTHTLHVTAGLGTFTHNDPHTDRHHALFDIGDEHTTNVFSLARNIDWNSDVFLTAGPSPTLVIDASGQVTQAQNISYTVTASQIIVNDIFFTDPGTALFTIKNVDGTGAPTPQITGTQSTFGFQENFDNVTITNASYKNLVINNIDPVNRTTIPEVTIDVPDVPFQFTVGQKFTPTLISIQNTAPRIVIPIFNQIIVIKSDISLNGVINNPIGTTSIGNASGDIMATGSQAVVRTNTFNATATFGSVSGAAGSLRVDLVESGGRPTHMTVSAGADVFLDLTGRQRTLGATSFTVNIDSVSAGGEASVLMEPALRETGLPANWYAVEVEEPLVPRLTEVISHFRPGPGDPPPVVETAIFGINAVAVDSTYNFGLIQGSNIDVNRTGFGTTIALTGNTNILTTGRIFANTNGNITLSETVGDMRVGLIVSTAGDVSLTSPASIVDAFNDPVADAYGNNITLSAPSGSIGSTDNPFDINSATPGFGVLNASASKDIIINETTGPLYVASATTFNGLIQITVYDSPNSGDDLYVEPNGRVSTFRGSVVLRAGDGVWLQSGSVVSTDLEFGGPITIQADYNNADGPVGTFVFADGTLRGTNIKVFGGDGPDVIDLSFGRVVGNIQAFGGNGDDAMYAGPDAVWFHGQGGDDYIVGGNGNDTLDGGPGADYLFGEGGDDDLSGGPGDDHLYGGPGFDTLRGGDGTDYGIAQDLPPGRTDDYTFKYEPTDFNQQFNDCELPTPPIILRQRSALPVAPGAGVPVLTFAQLQPVITEAIHRWDVLVGNSAALQGATFYINSLPDNLLGETYGGNTIVIDPTAQGHGWFVDPTPADDAEFVAGAPGELVAAPSGPAAGAMDLLTVVMHELGHVLGYGESPHGHDLMTEALGLGVRRLPSAEDVAAILHEPFAADLALSLPLPVGLSLVGASGRPEATPAASLPLVPALAPPPFRGRGAVPEVSPAVRRWLGSVLAGMLAGRPAGSDLDLSGSPVPRQTGPAGSPAADFWATSYPPAGTAAAGAGWPGVADAGMQLGGRTGSQGLAGLSLDFLMPTAMLDDLMRDAAILACLNGRLVTKDRGNEAP